MACTLLAQIDSVPFDKYVQYGAVGLLALSIMLFFLFGFKVLGAIPAWISAVAVIIKDHREWQSKERQSDRESRQAQANLTNQALSALQSTVRETSDTERASQERRNDRIVDAIQDQTKVFISHFEQLKESIDNSCSYNHNPSSNGYDSPRQSHCTKPETK